MGRRDAERINVGKRRASLLHAGSDQRAAGALARQGKRVARLKSGDPMVFGRAGEEITALRKAGVAYQIVPGVSAALAAAADAAVPMTLRKVSTGVFAARGADSAVSSTTGRARRLRADIGALHGQVHGRCDGEQAHGTWHEAVIAGRYRGQCRTRRSFIADWDAGRAGGAAAAWRTSGRSYSSAKRWRTAIGPIDGDRRATVQGGLRWTFSPATN